MRTHTDIDVEIAGWAAVFTGFALAGHAQAGAVVDASWHIDLQGFRFTLAACAAAIWTFFLDDLAAPAAFRAGGLGLHAAERCLLHAGDAACAVTTAAGFRAGARLCA